MRDPDMEARIDDVIRESQKRVDCYTWLARQIVLLRDRAEKAEATVESLVARIEDAEAVLSTGREP